MNNLFQSEDKLFSEWRIRLYASGVISIAFGLFYLTYFASAHGWPVLPDGNPTCIDFGIFWLSGKLAVAGDVARIFDHSAFSDAQAAFFRPGNCDWYQFGINPNRFWYPPTFLFFTYPFGLMPYLIALAVWTVILFFLYEATIYAIIPRRTVLIAAASPVLVIFLVVYLGQNGFLTTALIGLSLVFMERRPWLAGMLLGLLAYKPHFGVLFPIVLVASRNWRAFGSAAATTIVLGVLAAMFFGYEGWVSFLQGFTDRTSALEAVPGFQQSLQSVFGLFHIFFGVDLWISWGAQIAVWVLLVPVIWMIWANESISHNLKAAALCAGILLISPYSLRYDLIILSIPAAFFVKEGMLRGFLPGERTGVWICWVLLFFPKLPTGPTICAVLLFLITRRIFLSYRGNVDSVYSLGLIPLTTN